MNIYDERARLLLAREHAERLAHDWRHVNGVQDMDPDELEPRLDRRVERRLHVHVPHFHLHAPAH